MENELIYDLANCAYIEGELIAEDNQHLKHMVTDMCEEGNIERILQYIAIAEKDIPPFAPKALAKEYLVCQVMHDWLTEVYPAAAEKWKSKAVAAYANLSRAYTARPFTRRFGEF